MLPDFQGLILEWIKREPKKVRQSLVFYPSQLGSKCSRKIFYEQFMEKDVEGSTLMVYEAGKNIHEWVKNFLVWCSSKKDTGIKLIQVEKPFNMVIRDNVLGSNFELEIHGRVDSVLEIDGKKYIWECKSIKSFWRKGEFGFEEYPLPLESHIEQVQPYMRSERCDRAIIFYVEKPTFKLKWFVVKYDAQMMKRLEMRMREVVSCAVAHKLPSPIDESRNYWECSYCPYFNECVSNYLPVFNLSDWLNI